VLIDKDLAQSPQGNLLTRFRARIKLSDHEIHCPLSHSRLPLSDIRSTRWSTRFRLGDRKLENAIETIAASIERFDHMVDLHTDIRSLGVQLYEMIAGRAPFVGATPGDMLVSILEREPPTIAGDTLEVPAELERIVQMALRKDREERYRTAEDFLVDLKSLQHELAIEAGVERLKQPTPSSRSAVTAINRKAITSRFSPLWLTRRRVGIVTALVGVVIIAGLASALILRKRSSPVQQTEIKSLAVLPFKPLSAASRDESLEMGMAETLIAKLGAIKQIVVRPMSAVRKVHRPRRGSR
jgi:serine/threonine protein kinase